MRRLLMMVAMMLMASSAFAQLGGGTLSGTVTDEQGGVLPGVTVTITGTDRTRHGRDGRSRQVPVPEPGARSYKVTFDAAGLRDQRHARTSSCAVGATTDLPVSAEGRDRRRDRHGQRRVADRRHQGDRHRDQLHVRRAAEDPDVARSVRADAQRAGRARRSRQHRRQRDRPAVELRRRRARGRRTRAGRSTASRSPTWPRPARRRPTSTTTTSKKSRSRPRATTSSRAPAAWA